MKTSFIIGMKEKTKIEVGNTSYEGIINAPKGKHILNIKVVDENKMEAKKEQEVVGDTEPTVTVKPQFVDGKVAFVIEASDDEKLEKIEITHNGGAKQTEEINEPSISQRYNNDNRRNKHINSNSNKPKWINKNGKSKIR